MPLRIVMAGLVPAIRVLICRLAFNPVAASARARKDVLAGGKRRIAPATHIEWVVRRNSFAELLGWRRG